MATSLEFCRGMSLSQSPRYPCPAPLDKGNEGSGNEIGEQSFVFLCWSRLKGMPQKDLINIRNYDVRCLIPKVCSAVLKNGAETLIESTVK